VNTAMIAASRRAANDLPWQALSSSDSSTLVKTGTAITVTFGARSRAIGSGDSSSPARHLKNCRSARNWMLAVRAAVPVQQLRHPPLDILVKNPIGA